MYRCPGVVLSPDLSPITPDLRPSKAYLYDSGVQCGETIYKLISKQVTRWSLDTFFNSFGDSKHSSLVNKMKHIFDKKDVIFIQIIKI